LTKESVSLADLWFGLVWFLLVLLIVCFALDLSVVLFVLLGLRSSLSLSLLFFFFFFFFFTKKQNKNKRTIKYLTRKKKRKPIHNKQYGETRPIEIDLYLYIYILIDWLIDFD